MQKATITSPRQGAIVNVPTPRPKEDWGLIKSLTAPICTEYKRYLTGAQVAQWAVKPLWK
ncbi:MAG: hypothetical protein KDE47_17605 [Caldilineaceae bacterium]|nr:hypothetical protein [Caldilineaceae bacterium]